MNAFVWLCVTSSHLFLLLSDIVVVSMIHDHVFQCSAVSFSSLPVKTCLRCKMRHCNTISWEFRIILRFGELAANLDSQSYILVWSAFIPVAVMFRGEVRGGPLCLLLSKNHSFFFCTIQIHTKLPPHEKCYIFLWDWVGCDVWEKSGFLHVITNQVVVS